MNTSDLIIVILLVVIVIILIFYNSVNSVNYIVALPIKESFASTKPVEQTESKPDLKNPDSANIVEYGQYVCYKKGTELNKLLETKVAEQKNQASSVTCKNDSLNKKFALGKEEIKERVGNCGMKNLPSNWYEIDPSLYYRMYKPPIALMEDGMIKGYNIGQYNTSSKIYEVGRIKLNDTTQKYAQPNNYILS